MITYTDNFGMIWNVISKQNSVFWEIERIGLFVGPSALADLWVLLSHVKAAATCIGYWGAQGPRDTEWMGFFLVVLLKLD